MASDAGILPLNYARTLISFKIKGLRLSVKSLSIPFNTLSSPLDAVSYMRTSRFLPAWGTSFGGYEGDGELIPPPRRIGSAPQPGSAASNPAPGSQR